MATARLENTYARAVTFRRPTIRDGLNVSRLPSPFSLALHRSPYRPRRKRRRARPSLCAGRDHAAGRIGRRKLRRVPRGARRRRQDPHLRRARAARAGAGLFLGPRLRSGASIRASPRWTTSPPRSHSSTATAPAGTRSRPSPPRPRSSRWSPVPASSARRRARAMTASPSRKLLDTTVDDRHRLGLSARGRNAGARRPAAGRRQGRHARAAFRPLARLRRCRQRRQPRPYPMGARRPARRQARLCRSRQPDVADRRTALLHQGLGRRLADRRIYRRGN